MAVTGEMGTQYRIGIGYDVHRLVEGRDLILGGEKIKHPTGLLGHSDADVLTHAIMSAILGGMSAGSLGDHFPDTDPEYKDIKSIDLLERVRIMMEEGGYVVENVDSMVICDEPRLGKYIDNIKLNLSVALRVPIDRISVKATSTEGLGYTGTGDGIAVQAICLLKIPGEETDKPAKKKKSGSKKKDKADAPSPLPKIKPGELKECVAWTDGATEGNPGPSGIGVVFQTSGGDVIGRLAEFIGEHTNNQAEYLAAIRAVKICRKWGVEKLVLKSDSQLMVRQINGQYKIKNQGILKLYYELKAELKHIERWKMEHIMRDENEEADKLSKLALKLMNR